MNTVCYAVGRIGDFATITRTPQEAAALVAGCGCDGPAAVAESFAVADPTSQLGTVTWSGVIGSEGELTGDGRLIENNALRWEDLPIPLRYAPVDNGGHDGAQVVGRIMTLERKKNGDIWGTGDLDMNSDIGREAARVVGENLSNGVSMDLDSVAFEIRVAKDLLESGMGGNPDSVDADGRVVVLEMSADDEIMVTTDARVRAATLVSIPAFSRAQITLDSPLPTGDSGQSLSAITSIDTVENPPEDAVCAYSECGGEVTALATSDDGTQSYFCVEHVPVEAEVEGVELAALSASGYPMNPPSDWFSDPQLPGATPLTITGDGRVFGHLAVWGTCHTAFTGQCVEPPHSPSGYAYFRTGSVLTAEGKEIPVGSITLDTLHAGRSLGATDAIAHYEHSGKATSDVSAGEDAFGIWVAGALRPGLPDDKLRALRASPISGDWRRIGGSLELVAALAVNSPGFPVPRVQGLVAGGAMHSLVASGMLSPVAFSSPAAGEVSLSGVDIDQLADKLAARMEQRTFKAKGDKLAAKIRKQRADSLARRVKQGG